MTKEQIYDAEIYPLMAEVIKICQLHKIAMLANFRTPSEEDPDLACTTALLTEAYEPAPEQLEALRVLRAERRALVLTTKDADGEVKSVDVILP